MVAAIFGRPRGLARGVCLTRINRYNGRRLVACEGGDCPLLPIFCCVRGVIAERAYFAPSRQALTTWATNVIVDW